MSDHIEYRDQIAAYALDALATPEKLEVERHLAGCEGCREYLTWLHPAVDLLPVSVEARTPPPSLKRSLMDAVEADVKEERRAEKTRKRSERGLWGTIWRPVTVGVLSVALVAGAVVGYLVADDPRSEFFEAESLARIGPEMAVSLEVQGNEGTLHVEKLPGLGADQDYQAWIQRDGTMEPSSTFDVRKHGEVPLQEPLEGADGVFLTREPEGGSEAPTEEPFMTVELS